MDRVPWQKAYKIMAKELRLEKSDVMTYLEKRMNELCLCEHDKTDHKKIHGNEPCMVIVEPGDHEEPPVYCMCGDFSKKP